MQYRILATFTNGKQYSATRKEARVVFRPFLKSIRSAHLQYREHEGESWRDSILVDYDHGSFEPLFGAAAPAG